MVRSYERKTNRAKLNNIEIMQAASIRVIDGKESVRKVADHYGINFMSLHRYCTKLKKGEMARTGYEKPRLVFMPDQEQLLADYILKASKIFYGLSPKEIRKFAYQFAVANEFKYPGTWHVSEMAGADWFSAFLKRHAYLAIRKPEATSLSRATSFNRWNVAKFFDNLGEVLQRYKFACSYIYNLDETGFTTVQRPNKIVAKRGAKQIGAITSAERGTLVTMIIAVSASGNSVPPMFIFPRVNFRDHFINGGPPGCIGTAHPSGWMTEINFLVFIRHFIKSTKCTKESPVLLTMDNHDSHISLELVDLCRDNGVIVVTFPPHCSHKLQPLDRSVYGPLKKFYNVACDGWMKSNPGKTITIYNIPTIVAEALPRAVTSTNIQNGFKVSGIYPFNRNVFGDEEFMPSDVTDRPMEDQIQPPQNNTPDPGTSRDSDAPVPGISRDPDAPVPGISRDLDAPVPGISRDLDAPVPGISRDLDAPVPGISRDLDAPVPGISRDLDAPVPGISRDLDAPVPGISRDPDAPVPGTSRDSDTPVPGISRDPDAPVPGISRDSDTPVPGISRDPDAPVPGTSRDYDAPVPGISRVADASQTSEDIGLPQGIVCSPEMIRPFRKASPRKTKGVNRKKRQTVVLTDTPERQKLAAEKNRVADKGKIKAKKQLSMDTHKQLKKRLKTSSTSCQVDCYCLVCEESYANSVPGESWVECLVCKGWSHQECTTGDPAYVCHMCDSDED